MLADPIKENNSKNRQVDVFSLVFVSADNTGCHLKKFKTLHSEVDHPETIDLI